MTQEQQADTAIENGQTPEGVANQENQYLTFILAKETYGLDILKVQEIQGWTELTQIPNAPKYIRGVINLRGEIVPILDFHPFHEICKEQGIKKEACNSLWR